MLREFNYLELSVTLLFMSSNARGLIVCHLSKILIANELRRQYLMTTFNYIAELDTVCSAASLLSLRRCHCPINIFRVVKRYVVNIVIQLFSRFVSKTSERKRSFLGNLFSLIYAKCERFMFNEKW